MPVIPGGRSQKAHALHGGLCSSVVKFRDLRVQLFVKFWTRCRSISSRSSLENRARHHGRSKEADVPTNAATHASQCQLSAPSTLNMINETQ